MDPMAVLGILTEKGAIAFPSIAAVALWFRIQKMEESIAAWVDRYVTLAEKTTQHIADSTSALRELRDHDRG